MRLVARRQQVGRDIAHGSNVGDHFDFFVNVWQFGKEFCFAVAFQQFFSDGVAFFVSSSQALGVCFVQEYLSFQNSCSRVCDVSVVAQSQVQQNLDRRAAFHVRQQFESELLVDLFYRRLTQNDFFQEFSFNACRRSRTWKCVVDEEVQ